MTPALAGLPFAAVDRWLRQELPDLFVGPNGGSAQGADTGAQWQAEVISGGLSNITYRLKFPHREVILRRPPLGGVLPSAHDMLREYRVMSALNATDVPVPQMLALCTDLEVMGSPFYVMAAVSGQVLRTGQDTAELSPEQRGEVSEQLVGALAELHAVDYRAVGLGEFGRPDGYCTRQIRRWTQQWQQSRTRDLPDMDKLLDGLATRIPTDSEGCIVHGDFRLDNTIFTLGDRPRIRSVLDWELSTLGDPLADLAMTLTYWHDPGDAERAQIPVAVGVTAHKGFPTANQFAERYAGLTGRDLSQLPFYLAFSAMKLAVILEGVHARYQGGHTISDGYENAGKAVPFLVARGLRQLG
jgi:aminoglycoside phosphotransferase (APT) family kinase protein